jgi:hypothetical protein
MGKERTPEDLNAKLKGQCASGGWAQQSVEGVTLKEGHCAPCKAADVVVVSEGEQCHCATLSVKVKGEALGPPETVVRRLHVLYHVCTWRMKACVGGCE